MKATVSQSSGKEKAVKAKRIQIAVACVLTTVLAGSGVALAQQPEARGAAETTVRDERTQQPVPPTASDESAGIPGLQQLIEQALENNPEIKSMQRRFDMMRARVPQAKALDEPMLSIGYMGNITPLQVQNGDPSSGRTISISQDLPFPGKRSLRGKVASYDADAEWWAFEQTRRNVVAEVKDAYFDLYYLTKALGVSNGHMMEGVPLGEVNASANSRIPWPSA
jgi:outer membrane protein TolC